MSQNILAKLEVIEFEEFPTPNIRLKLTERDCPKCEAVLIHNNSELCFECLNCGYIDCGNDDD